MALFDKILSRIEEFLVAIALGVATAITFIETVLRYVFETSLGSSYEVTIYLLIFVGFIGASIGVRDKVHIGVDILVEKFPYGVQKVVSTTTLLISAFFCLIVAYLGVKQVGVIAAFGQVTPEMEIPLTIPISIIPIGFSLMTLRFLQEAVKVIKTPTEEMGKKAGGH
ncbi:TRAP transporter small permease [Metallumcola ferriviriculae]|uniref:TRAP transporter small permease n=1 Tax=Metallumcola ferriviriculae TaxID=3039180 RepID=A0AAU0USU8_9FIRM|nr:TRAP transporter small permease [Desulfitibacteraceae bacterium MK1]